MKIKHTQYAHCESGAIATLISEAGFKISEPMVFGITSTLFFVYMPIIKLNNMPLVSYREVPCNIVNKIPKILNFFMTKQRYFSCDKASADLDFYLKKGQLVGLQTSVFYLPYFPKDMRFHFNAHNLIVCKKNDDDTYLISDPVFEDFSICDKSSLLRARFAKGVFAPKGFLYTINNNIENINLTPIIKKAIRKTAKKMLDPFPYTGVKGMRKLAKKIKSLDALDKRYTQNFLTHIVRMQEEIGTGGGGFRFLYAAFLQEATKYDLDVLKLTKSCELLNSSGDKLREFAQKCVLYCKNKQVSLEEIAELLEKIADIEEEAFKILKTI